MILKVKTMRDCFTIRVVKFYIQIVNQTMLWYTRNNKKERK